MYRIRLSLVASAAVALLPLSQASSQTPSAGEIEVDVDRTADLSAYDTYAWSKEQVPVKNLANHLRLVNAIQDHMEKKGYRIDPRKPDVLVQYHVERHAGVKSRSTQEPSVWDPSNLRVQVDLSREETVSLSIELVEAETRFPLWSAKGTYPLGTPDRAEREIKAAVEDLFSQYPEEEDEER